MTEITKRQLYNFFELVDKYLIADLNTMIYEVSDRPSGGLGFPILQTLMSGMELIGKFLGDNKNLIKKFINNELAKDSVKYKNQGYLFDTIIRNTINHIFLLDVNFTLSKHGGNMFEKLIDDKINIDLKILFEDFLKTYTRIKSDILSTESIPKKVQNGYTNLIKETDITMTKHKEGFEKIKNEISAIKKGGVMEISFGNQIAKPSYTESYFPKNSTGVSQTLY